MGPAYTYLGRLDHHCVPSSQAGSHLPGEHHQGIVPGDNNATDPAIQKKKTFISPLSWGTHSGPTSCLLSPRPAIFSRARLLDTAPKVLLKAAPACLSAPRWSKCIQSEMTPSPQGMMAWDTGQFLMGAMGPVYGAVW